MSNTALALRTATADDLLLQCEARSVHLTGVERKLLNSMGRKPIRQTDDRTLLQDCGALVKNAMRDMGINKPPDAYDAARFMDILREYFADMTISDVKQAFEFFILGELDAYLPRDSKGKTVDHFQQFSARFYIALLRAYRQKQLSAKNDVTGKLGLLLIEEEAANRDPYADRFAFIAVLKSLCMDIAKGGRPTMVITEVAELLLKRTKLIPAIVEPTQADYLKARDGMSRRKDSAVASVLNRMLREDALSEDLRSVAHTICVRRLLYANAVELGEDEIAKRFDWLIDWYRQRKQSAGS